MSKKIKDETISDVLQFLMDMSDQVSWKDDKGEIISFKYVSPNDISMRALSVLRKLSKELEGK